MKSLVKEGHTKILELSGTPFNLLDQFAPEQVYTWDYVMEQQAKLKWDLENPEHPNLMSNFQRYKCIPLR
ncbi:MAG: hypothetical protein ACLRWM_12365 [Streptococcus sp.]